MDAQAWHQAVGRIGSLEDLLRRNEGSLGGALGRLKDAETALNTMHRALGRIGPDLSGTIDELKTTKRRLDLVDATAQSKLREVEAGLTQEIRNNKPVPLTSDPTFQRLAGDYSTTQAEVQETISQVRRLTDAVSADGKAIKAVEQDSRWLAEQLREQASVQRDFSTSTSRRIDQVTTDVQNVQQEVQQVDSGLRKIIDAAVRASREEMLLRLEQETKARMALQADFVAAFGKMREDVVKGFSETAANLKNLDETGHSLETVLRAEVRSRMAASEEVGRRIDGVEERLRREALSAAEYLKALDTQMSGALREVREVSASECRSQLDTVWRSVDDLSDQVKKMSGKSASDMQSQDEIAATRTKMTIDAAVNDSREDILKVMESRIAAATAEIEGLASKSELQELRTRLDLKLQEIERQSANRKQAVRFDVAEAPEHTSSTASAMKLKKLSERMDDSEKQLIVVAEAVRDVHDELVEKLEKLETQSAALDALQKSLQETFDRDQSTINEQTAAMRSELVGVMDELENIRGPKPTTGDDDEATPAGKSSSPTDADSPSAVYSHRTLETKLQSLQSQHDTLQHDFRRQHAELKQQQDQLFERHVSLAKTQREDVTSLRGDISSVSTRAQANAEEISDRLHQVTQATNENFAKLNDDVAALGEGKSLTPRTSAPAIPPPAPSAPAGDFATKSSVAALAERVEAIEGALIDLAGESPRDSDSPRGSKANNNDNPPPPAKDSKPPTPAKTDSKPATPVNEKPSDGDTAAEARPESKAESAASAKPQSAAGSDAGSAKPPSAAASDAPPKEPHTPQTPSEKASRRSSRPPSSAAAKDDNAPSTPPAADEAKADAPGSRRSSAAASAAAEEAVES